MKTRVVAMLVAALLAMAGGTAAGNPAPDGGVFYQIFVRSFQDSDGDGIGDLRGVVERLDYLEALGVTGIWLTPIHPSPSYHGYDVTDYRDVHPEFGTLADLDALVAEAHAREILVVLDLVVNHTSSEHPWFASSARGDPEYRDWYVWSERAGAASGIGGGPAWHPLGGSYYLGLFWSGMPDLNYRNPRVTDEMKDVARFWLDRGVDGFRVDAIQYIVEGDDGTLANAQENVDWVTDFNAFVRVSRPGAFVLGETWTQTPTILRYHRDASLDMSFNFPLYAALRDAVVGRNAGPLEQVVEQDGRLYPPDAAYGTFLGNHDLTRAATALSPLRRDERRLGLAAGLLFTLPGVPFVYYGDEIGMPNGSGSEDPAKRTPMRWEPVPGAGFTTGTPWLGFSTEDDSITVASQRGDPASLLETYRGLIALRRSHPALERGATRVLATDSPSLLAFVREAERERIAVLANLGGREHSVDLAALGLRAEETLWGPAPSEGMAGIGPLQIVVLRLDTER